MEIFNPSSVAMVTTVIKKERSYQWYHHPAGECYHVPETIGYSPHVHPCQPFLKALYFTFQLLYSLWDVGLWWVESSVCCSWYFFHLCDSARNNIDWSKSCLKVIQPNLAYFNLVISPPGIFYWKPRLLSLINSPLSFKPISCHWRRLRYEIAFSTSRRITNRRFTADTLVQRYLIGNLTVLLLKKSRDIFSVLLSLVCTG